MSTKSVFTTGEAAKICKVSQQTIIRCFDNGTLKGFRVPGSRFRRIPWEQLYAFMKENNIPTDALESSKKKVLVVDDDETLVDLMVEAFERDGRFEIRTANNGFDAGMLVKEIKPDLVVLDVMLPDIQGFDVCRQLRGTPETQDIPVLFLTAKTETEDKIKGFKLGAIDYLVKPFDPDILLLKIEAILRQSSQMPAEDEKFQIGNYIFDSEKRVLQLKDYMQRLSPKESSLLQLLAEKKGELLSREEALIKIWKEDTYFTAQSMNVFITKLRKYLSLDIEYLIEIENVHGSGFILEVRRRG